MCKKYSHPSFQDEELKRTNGNTENLCWANNWSCLSWQVTTSLLFLSDLPSKYACICSIVLTYVDITALGVTYHANRLHYQWQHLTRTVLYLTSVSSCCDRWWGNWAQEWLELYTDSLHNIFVRNTEGSAFCWRSTFKKKVNIISLASQITKRSQLQKGCWTDTQQLLAICERAQDLLCVSLAMTCAPLMLPDI